MEETKFNPEKTIKALWVIDSETSERTLRDLATGKCLARMDRDGRIINEA